MQYVTFLSQFIQHPRSIGAIIPSSPMLASAMIQRIDFDNVNCIVELGPGTGIFTEELIKRKKKNTPLILIEINERFAKTLHDQYQNEPNVHVIHGSAENVQQYVQELNITEVDVVISGLPFSSLPNKISSLILLHVQKTLSKNGLFVTFQYSQIKKIFLGNFFSDIVTHKVWLNLPPAYVYTCKR